MQSYTLGTTQPSPQTVHHAAGAFVEADGSRSTPTGFLTYVIVLPLTTGLIMPAAALAYLLWQRETELGVATVGVYLLCVLVQIFSEEAYLRPKGQGRSLDAMCLLPVGGLTAILLRVIDCLQSSPSEPEVGCLDVQSLRQPLAAMPRPVPFQQ